MNINYNYYILFLLLITSINLNAQVEKDSLSFSLEGVVMDVDTDLPISDTKVLITGSDSSSIILKTDSNGLFDKYPLKKETNYSITVSKKYYVTMKVKESTVGVVDPQRFYHEYALQKIMDCGPFFSPFIPFKRNKFTIGSIENDSLSILLDDLFIIMKDNPKIVIGLTGNQEEDEKKNLSKKRAIEVRKALVEKGVHPKRVTIHKETLPSSNRRVVFKVVGNDWKVE